MTVPRAARRNTLALTAALAALLAAHDGAAQDTVPAAAHPAAGKHDSLPFGPGEKLEYDVTLGGLGVGKASMEVVGHDSVRGHHVLHTLFRVKGGIPFFRVNDELESWFDPETMVSYRFIQRINEGGYHPLRVYDLYPERAQYEKQGKPGEASTWFPSVNDPLDDGAFFYFVRTVPLDVGQKYEYVRYFIPEKNPVIVRVIRRDTIKVKAGTFATVVIQPVIKSGGVFADGGEALMWLTDDSRHMLVQMKVKTKIPLLSSLNLYLRSIVPTGTLPADSAAKAK